MQTKEVLNVLVIDDSAVVRQTLKGILSQAPDMSVTVAADPIVAQSYMKWVRPDVIVLDLEMPRMSGLQFLKKLMAENPIPVVVCSGLAGPGTETGIKALEEGAIRILTKPQLGVREFLEESATLLTDAIREASLIRRECLKPKKTGLISDVGNPKLTADAVIPKIKSPIRDASPDKIVAIGASAGGIDALRDILKALDPDSPGVIIVQHLPEVFTAAFARRLNEVCEIEVSEAKTGDFIKPGQALVAPGNRHTLVHRSGSLYEIEVRDGPLVSRHRPSVDVLFRSTAMAAGASAIGVILTGMGDDGAAGLLEMKTAGATTIAQDENTCLVFGMPREAIAIGGVDHILPLQLIPGAIKNLAASINPTLSKNKSAGPD